MKKAVFSLLYNTYDVIETSFDQLRKTAGIDLQIYALDNAYPNLKPAEVKKLVRKFDIQLVSKERKNRGLSGGYNEIINALPEIKYAILYDCDSYPITFNWAREMFKVVENSEFRYLCLMFDHAKKEMLERGFQPIKHESGNVIWWPMKPCIQSISCANLEYLRLIGGLREPREFYGGLEMAMWSSWNSENKIGYLDGYNEASIPAFVDPKYTAYKFAYAHHGYNGSFDDYLKENP